MYSLIMFDMDGTLIDSVPGLVKTLNDTMEHYGLPKLSNDEIREIIGPRVYDTFRGKFGKSHEEAMEMTDWFRNDYAEKHVFDAKLYPGIKELVKELKDKGFMTAIVTNKRYDYAESIAEHFGLSDVFDKIYGTDFDNTVEKHHLIEQCLKDFGVKRKDAVLIGDTVFDEDAAKKADIDFIPVSYGFGKWECDACGNVAEILKCLID